MFGQMKAYSAYTLEKKERVASIRCIDKETESVILGADFFMGRSASAEYVWCSLWVYTPSGYTSGKARAGGAGYCKKSAAFGMACDDADINIADMRVYGAGMTKVKEAALAICKAAGHSDIIYLEV